MSCHCHNSDGVSALLLTLLPVPPLLLTRITNISFCYCFLPCIAPVLVVLVSVLTLLQHDIHNLVTYEKPWSNVSTMSWVT